MVGQHKEDKRVERASSHKCVVKVSRCYHSIILIKKLMLFQSFEIYMAVNIHLFAPGYKLVVN